MRTGFKATSSGRCGRTVPIAACGNRAGTSAREDAAAVNAAQWALANRLQSRWPVAFGSGGRTQYNRTRQGYEKDHWIDAACVGESGARVTIPEGKITL